MNTRRSTGKLTKRYIIDEYGTVNSNANVFQEESVSLPLPNNPSKQSAQRSLISSTQPENNQTNETSKEQNFDKIPESTPAGFLKLSNLPSNKRYPSARPPKSLKEKRINANRRSTASKKSLSSADRMVKCHYCESVLPQSKIAWHIDRYHTKLENSTTEKDPTNSIISVSTVDRMIKCHFCDSMVRQSNLKRHIEKVHSAQKEDSAESKQEPHTIFLRDLAELGKHFDEAKNSAGMAKPARVLPNGQTYCPVCNVAVKHSRLANHIKKVHNQASAPSHLTQSQRAISQQEKSLGHSLIIREDETYTQEEFDEIFTELRDGGKYLGYMQREHGKFGSLPLYDDYDDESDAD